MARLQKRHFYFTCTSLPEYCENLTHRSLAQTEQNKLTFYEWHRTAHPLQVTKSYNKTNTKATILKNSFHQFVPSSFDWGGGACRFINLFILYRLLTVLLCWFYDLESRSFYWGCRVIIMTLKQVFSKSLCPESCFPGVSSDRAKQCRRRPAATVPIWPVWGRSPRKSSFRNPMWANLPPELSILPCPNPSAAGSIDSLFWWILISCRNPSIFMSCLF